ncbi:aminotransferase class IV family protein [Candidatus Kaiserbacteria bacterium]|nr:aminotransferase class IV family protein [Candidatus Kaiserbacteria bacterium]
MAFKYFSHNGELKPASEAVIPLSNIEYSYGFGVYETIRVADKIPYFLLDHIERLGESARIIGLEHGFSGEQLETHILELIKKNDVETANLKILLIGAKEKENAQLFILCLNPLFPDKKLYREGATFVTYEYERAFPHAKTLNMLQSYLAYRKAKEADCYDALLINREGCITEGTRTNFFCIKGKTLITPPESEILLGVTRKAVLKAATQNGYELEEKVVTWGDLRNADGAFVTSTSSKIIPVRRIDDQEFHGPEALKELMRLYDAFLDTCNGKME